MKGKNFSRTIVTSTIKVAKVDVINGKIETSEIDPIIIIGTSDINHENALKLAKAKYKEIPSLVVLSVDNEEEVRCMEFNTFLKYSTPIERPISQQKKN